MMRRRPVIVHRRRLWGLLLALTMLFVGIVARVADLQLVTQERYVAYGQSQRLRSEVLPASRGSVVDRTGAELAMSVPAMTVWVDPRRVTDPAGAAEALAPVLGRDEAWVLERVSRPSRFEYLARQIDEDTAAAIADLGLGGVQVRAEPTRVHPSGDLARTVLGTSDIDGHGVSGVELQFDELLTGTPGEVMFERSLNGGVPIPVAEHQIVPAQRGDDVVLTIDASLQHLAEEVLADWLEEMGAEGASMIVSVPATGEVLAMVNLTADPATGRAVPAGYNAALVDSFAPGSVLKLVTIGASLEEGRSAPLRQLSVPDEIVVANSRFRDHTPHATEDWSVTRILVDSSNVGTIKLGQELGPERVSHYLDAFGFGQPTGIGFPGESQGLVRPVEDWHGSDIAGAVIGTGVGVTAAQVLGAYNVVANGGEYVPLRLVSGHIDEHGIHHEVPVAEPRRVVSERTSAQLADMLTQVVTDGTGQRAAVDGYDVAGKTGTAWKRLDDGSFGDEGNRNYMATFVGFAPVEDPQVSVIVVVDQPQLNYSGGYAAAPAFSRVTEHALRLLAVPPSRARSAADEGPILLQASSNSTEHPRVRAPVVADPAAGDDAPAGDDT
jgi:cell division protein FtsI (penicillin-binding protein 3)